MRGRRAGRHKNMRKRRTRKVGGNMPVGPCRLLAPPPPRAAARLERRAGPMARRGLTPQVCRPTAGRIHPGGRGQGKACVLVHVGAGARAAARRAGGGGVNRLFRFRFVPCPAVAAPQPCSGGPPRYATPPLRTQLLAQRSAPAPERLTEVVAVLARRLGLGLLALCAPHERRASAQRAPSRTGRPDPGATGLGLKALGGGGGGGVTFCFSRPCTQRGLSPAAFFSACFFALARSRLSLAAFSSSSVGAWDQWFSYPCASAYRTPAMV